MDTLYYDGQCPLCTREIRALEKCGTPLLLLVDIHGHEPGPDDPDRQAMLRRLHMRTGDGQWLVGVDATIQAWSHTRWRLLFKPLGWPILQSWVSRIYEYWARRRYASMYCGANGLSGERSPGDQTSP